MNAREKAIRIVIESYDAKMAPDMFIAWIKGKEFGPSGKTILRLIECIEQALLECEQRVKAEHAPS